MDISQTVKGIVILKNDGKRALAKYFDDKLDGKQVEKQVFTKTRSHKAKDEILVIDNCIIFHRCLTDLHIYLIGHKNENPLILKKLLSCIVEVISEILNKNVDHQSFNEHLDQIILALDEICDQGIILETDPNSVIERVCLKDSLSEPSYASLLQSATEHLRNSFK